MSKLQLVRAQVNKSNCSVCLLISSEPILTLPFVTKIHSNQFLPFSCKRLMGRDVKQVCEWNNSYA